MAKSLRSKSKRKNRSVLRKQISEPLVKKRLENLHEALQKEIKLKSKNVLAGLKKVLTKSSDKASIKMDIDNNDSKNNDDNDDDNDEEEENNGNTTLKKQEKKLARVALLMGKKKGKKPRKDNGKKLEWF